MHSIERIGTQGRLCFLLLSILFSALISPSSCETVALLQNGGFEDGPKDWMTFSYCRQLPSEGVISGYRMHSGRYSFLTPCGTGGEHCFGVGGGASQKVKLNKPAGLKLSFWIYMFNIPEVNAWTDIALIVDFWTPQIRKTLVYYVAWAENIPVYDHYPLPAMSSEDVTNVLLHDLQIERWNYVERDLQEDFEKSHPDIIFNAVEGLQITLLAVTFQRLSLVPKGAFWDDLSLTSERGVESTPTPSTHAEEPVQTPNQTELLGTTPTADLGQQVPEASTLAVPTILILLAAVVTAILIRSRKKNERAYE